MKDKYVGMPAEEHIQRLKKENRINLMIAIIWTLIVVLCVVLLIVREHDKRSAMLFSFSLVLSWLGGYLVPRDKNCRKMKEIKVLLEYLRSKNQEDYTYLDTLLEKHSNNALLAELSKYNFAYITISTQLSKQGNVLRIHFIHQNIEVTISPAETDIVYSIYPICAEIAEVNKNTFHLAYDAHFSFDAFMETIYEKISQHPALVTFLAKSKKRKKFKQLAIIFLLIPVAFLLSMTVLVYGFQLKIQMNFWLGFLFILFPLFLFCIFWTQSKK